MPWKALAQLFIVGAVGVGGGLLGTPGIRPAASDVIAISAVLAAFLVQVMLLLATILSPAKLTPDLLREIAAELDRKQGEAFVLFCIYVGALTAFLAIKLTGEWKPTDDYLSLVSSYGLAGVACTLTAFAVVRTVAFLSTMRDVQTLRHRLLLQDARVAALKESSVPAKLDQHEPEPGSPPFGLPATGYK